VSGYLIIIVGLIYSGICIEQIIKHEFAMAVVWAGYALANAGMWASTK
jgi:hypothetical protein